MQGYDSDGNDIGCKCVKRIRHDDCFAAVGSIRRAKPGGMSHAKILDLVGRERAGSANVPSGR